MAVAFRAVLTPPGGSASDARPQAPESRAKA
jgi:hypothetical protein